MVRRTLLGVVAVVSVVALGACAAPTVLMPIAATGVAHPPARADTAVTHRVCRAATGATLDGRTYLTQQLRVIDTAAAGGDPARVVLAANAIQDRLVALAASMAWWSRQAVSPPVRGVLLRALATLRAICAESYDGTPDDINRQLVDLAHAFAGACGPVTV